MNDNISIDIKNLSKKYKLYPSAVARLKEMANPSNKTYHTEFWALRDINLEITKGSTFAIVGQNGSGKSTLLQIISGIIKPSSGEIDIRGRISALLDLGAGFHQEFTGRENVFMQGALMGISKHEMNQHFDDIAGFADIGDFLDQPVKTYSSGMYLRLAFATAININPDILIIDEVLAVGDDMFKRRCYRKIQQFQEDGKTILFVSHNLPTVTSICNRAMLLDKGEMITLGTPKEIVHRYSRLLAEREAEYIKQLQGGNQQDYETKEVSQNEVSTDNNFGTGEAEITNFQILDSENKQTTVLETGEKYRFRFIVHFKKDVPKPDIGMNILTLTGLEIFGICPMVAKNPMGPVKANSAVTTEFVLTINLNPGEYSVNVNVAEHYPSERVFLTRHLDIQTFKVVGERKSYGLIDMDAEIDIST